jgi:hypothetical protein
MAARSLLREAFMADANRHSSLGADFSRRSPFTRSGKESMHLCNGALPIAAEIQAILKGGSPHQVLEPDSKSCIFGCSPPPRDCTNPLVRDSSFDSMRGARSMATSAAGSCSTSYYQSMERTDGFGAHSCMSPPASALSTA